MLVTSFAPRRRAPMAQGTGDVGDAKGEPLRVETPGSLLKAFADQTVIAIDNIST